MVVRDFFNGWESWFFNTGLDSNWYAAVFNNNDDDQTPIFEQTLRLCQRCSPPLRPWSAEQHSEGDRIKPVGGASEHSLNKHLQASTMWQALTGDSEPNKRGCPSSQGAHLRPWAGG